MDRDWRVRFVRQRRGNKKFSAAFDGGVIGCDTINKPRTIVGNSGQRETEKQHVESEQKKTHFKFLQIVVLERPATETFFKVAIRNSVGVLCWTFGAPG